MLWIKVQVDVRRNRTFQTMNAERFRQFFNLMMLSKESGLHGKLPAVDDIAYELRLHENDAVEMLQEFEKAGLISCSRGLYSICGWDKTQSPDDSKTRVAAFRERQRNGSCNGSCNGNCNGACRYSTVTETEDERYGNGPRVIDREREENTPPTPSTHVEGDESEIPLEGRDRLFAVEDVAAPVSPKPRVEKKGDDGLTATQRKWFDEFWENVWAKIGVGAARKAYGKNVRDERTAADVLAATKRYAEFLRANKDPQYWPHPSTWLNGEHWLDELPVASTSSHPPAPVTPYLPEWE